MRSLLLILTFALYFTIQNTVMANPMAEQVFSMQDTDQWQNADLADISGTTIKIPAARSGTIESPEFALPSPAMPFLFSFDFQTSKIFTPFEYFRINFIWYNAAHQQIGTHRQHPWFTFPTEGLYGHVLPFHRPIAADSIPHEACYAKIQFTFKSSNKEAGADDALTISDITLKKVYSISGDTFANWFELGNTVRFRGKIPGNPVSVTGEITDTENQVIERQTVTTADFIKNGWVSKITTPGFYTIRFFTVDAENQTVPVIDTYYAQRLDRNKFFEEVKYTRDFQNFVITATMARQPKDIPSQIGASYMGFYQRNLPYRLGASVEDCLRATKLIGAHYLRGFIDWDKVETSPGVYDWKQTDDGFALVKQYGYEQKQMDIGFLNTPRFYTSRSENTKEMTYSERYQFYPPNDINAWKNFIVKAVSRYSGVNTWEVWNEPHLPGHSIFWKSTPEKYVELLRVAHDAIKSVDSNKQISLAGIGMRYLPFYEEILKLGAGNDFSILPLHGTWAIPDPFEQLNKNYNSPPKTTINNEWHNILYTTTDPDIYREEELAFNMVLDYLNMLRSGVKKIATFGGFSSVWNGGCEREMTELRKRSGGQILGLFRTYPRQEPRYAALVLRNLIDRFSGKIVYHDTFSFSEGDIQCAWLDSDGSDFLAIWNLSEKKMPLPDELANAIAETRILNIFGQALDSDEVSTLKPMQLCYAIQPDVEVVSAWKNKLSEIQPYKKTKVLDLSKHSFYRDGYLFDENMNAIDEQDLVFAFADEYVSFLSLPKPESYSAKFAVAMNKEGMELYIIVNDETYCKDFDLDEIQPWHVDSVQFALDCEGKGDKNMMTEIVVADNYISKTMAATVGGDIPDNSTPINKNLDYAILNIERLNGQTIYKIHIDSSELYPLAMGKPNALRFSFLVNQNNGNGREGYLTWAGGIGDMKAPERFGTLSAQTSGQVIADQSTLRHPFQKAKLLIRNQDTQQESIQITADGLETQEKQGCGVMSSIKMRPGIQYAVSFDVKGNANKVESFISGHKMQRTNISTITLLDHDWKTIRYKFIAPNDEEQLNTYIFSWMNPSANFEIRNFLIKECTEDN